ncbi:MAG: DUF1295 domain-containing protein [Bacilli bacterium]
MKQIKQSKKIGLLFITITYVLAILVAILVFKLLPEDATLIMKLLVCDLCATLFVFIIGTIFSNATFYDPYWSVQPIVLTIAMMINFEAYAIGDWLLLMVVCAWGVRLTVNWVITFKDMNHQDWRYDDLKVKSKKLYPAVNLLGIHLFPTYVVFMCMVPIISWFSEGFKFTYLTLIGVIVALGGVVLEIVADTQKRNFRKNHERSLVNVGLWKKGRHPNYFGELVFWLGIYLFALLPNISIWPQGLGLLINILMFVFISIPMADAKSILRHPDYKIYKEQSRMFI